MKKLLLALAVFSCIAAVVIAQQAAYSVNIVGYVKVQKPADALNLLGVNLGTSATTLNELISKESFSGDFTAINADQIITYIPGTGYKTYALYDLRLYGSNLVEWRDFDTFASGPATNPAMPVGSAVWLKAAGSVSNVDVVCVGEVVTDQFVTNTVVEGLQMLSYPFACDVDLNDTMICSNASGDFTAVNADKITLWDVDAQGYKTYALYDLRAYGSDVVEWRPFDNFTTNAPAIPLKLGQGMWYNAQAEFTWVESNRYFEAISN